MVVRDIAVCGCGPAGLAAALLLSRQGHRVRVFEQFETARPVGSGLLLQPTGLAVLRRLSLLDAIEALGAPVTRLFGRTGSNRLVLDVRYAAMGGGWRALAVHRSALFGVLHEAVRAANIPIETGWTIRAVERGARPILIGAHGARGDTRVGPFDLVVDALGAH